MKSCSCSGWVRNTCPSSAAVSSSCHPHPEGLGRTSCVTSVWAQMCPPWYTERLVCCRSAYWVGGIFSSVLDYLEKRSCLASLTFVRLLVRSYRRTTKRSITAKHALSTTSGDDDRISSVAVSSKNTPRCPSCLLASACEEGNCITTSKGVEHGQNKSSLTS